jgi:hypothetical protein
MLGQSGKLRIRTCAGQYLGIASGYRAPTLALECLGDKLRPTACRPRIDELVNKIDKLVWEPNRYLLAHPTMEAEWDHYGMRSLVGRERNAPASLTLALTNG